MLIIWSGRCQYLKNLVKWEIPQEFFLINRSMHEHTRVFTTLKSMCEVFNKEFEDLSKKGMARNHINDLKFNLNALRSLNWSYPHKYKGYTVRRVPIERT